MTYLVVIAQIYTLVIILLSSILFVRLGLKGKSLGSFRLQLSIFILIWAAAEIPRGLSNLGLISTSAFGIVGLFLHMTSMAAFAAFVGIKSFKFLRASPQGLPPTPSTNLPGLPIRSSGEADQ
jgi:hypothetical protein